MRPSFALPREHKVVGALLTQPREASEELAVLTQTPLDRDFHEQRLNYMKKVGAAKRRIATTKKKIGQGKTKK